MDSGGRCVGTPTVALYSVTHFETAPLAEVAGFEPATIWSRRAGRELKWNEDNPTVSFVP